MASRPGWLSQSRFALPHKVYGHQHGRVHLLIPLDATGAGLNSKSKLPAWQSGVAELARGNHVLMFVIMLALAAPLVRLVGQEGGGFQLVAPSSRGKTTAAVVGASVWGLGLDDGPTETWSTTPNKIDDTVEQYNDLLLVLDETALAELDERIRARLIANAAYRIAAGQRKARLGETRHHHAWRVLLLSTSEKTSHEIAKLGRMAIQSGQLARLTDIILPSTEDKGIYEDLHQAGSLAAFCKALRQNVERTRGAAGDAYLERLVADVRAGRSKLVAWLEARMSFYQKRLHSPDPVAQRVGQRFALAYAAARLAAKYGVLPYSQQEILAAIRYCHACADSSAGLTAAQSARSSNDGRTSGAKFEVMVAEYIVQNCSRFLSSSRKAPPSKVQRAPGFIQGRAEGGEDFLFLPAAFEKEVCGSRYQETIEALKLKGMLRLHEGGKTSIPRTLPQPLGRTRVICVKGEIIRLASSKGKTA